MKRIWIVLLVVAVALVVALPAVAKKPDKPGNPNTGFKPMACVVDHKFLVADVRYEGETTQDVEPKDGEFTLEAKVTGGFNETFYTVELADLEGEHSLVGDAVLCVTVELVEGTVKDLRVRWMDCFPVCGLYRATGKDLRNFNNKDIFSAGVSVADWDDSREEWTVAVMPLLKSDTAKMKVMIGIDEP